MILIDSNVLIDIFTRDLRWVAWSSDALADASESGPLAVNQIIIAEVAPQIGSLKTFMNWLSPFGVEHLSLSDDAAFKGGMAFLKHRQQRRSVLDKSKTILPDFLIGGHAEVMQATILTRDPRFYRTYFPSVPLITPDETDT